MPGYSYPDSASVPVVCLCVWRVGILTSTLASQKRSKPEENSEELPQSYSEGAASFVDTGSNPQSQHQGNLIPLQLDLPCVPQPSLPLLPPCSPTTSSFPFPPGDCQLSDINLTPGNDRQSVLRCPTSQGYSCSPGVIGDRLVAVTPSVCRLPTEDTPQALTWDNYKDSPTFSLSNTWTVDTESSLWSDFAAVRQSIASSTDPYLIDSESDLLGIERLRSDNEPVRKVELVSTDCSSLARSPVFGDCFEVENTSEIVAVSEAVAEMNQDKNNELRQLHEDLQDEIDDLDPASVTRETAL